MTYVRSLTGFRPPARYDAVPFTLARIQESALEASGFVTIETKTLTPVDADPANPASRNFTTALATLAAGWYRVVWEDAAASQFTGDAVYFPAASGATYATPTDLDAYIEGGSGLAAAAAERLLTRASRDVDWAAGAWPIIDTTTGLKFDPSTLPVWQRAALSRATCAQAEYRDQMGEDFMVKAQHTAVRGPDFSVTGELPYIGPKTLRELASGGLLRAGPGAGIGSIFTGRGTVTQGDVIGNL